MIHIPEPLKDHRCRLHSGQYVGVCTGVALTTVEGTFIQVQWPDDTWTMEHVNSLVWMSNITNQCAQCDLDRHRCAGCGVPVEHGTTACERCFSRS